MSTAIGRLAALLLIIAGIIAYLMVGVNLFDKIRSSALRMDLKSIDRSLCGERILGHPLPRRLKEYLAANMENRSTKAPGLDPWGKEYLYEIRPGGYAITSMGPDQQPGTADDLSLIRHGENQADFEIVSAATGVGGWMTAPAATVADSGAEGLESLRAFLDPAALEKFRAPVDEDASWLGTLILSRLQAPAAQP